MGELAMDDDDSFNPPASAARAKSAPRRRGRLVRWTLRLVIMLVALILAIAICLQIILWTDIPRKLVLQKLQRALGLRVEAPAMSIGWSGHTTLENVKISLPLAQQSFLEVPRMEVTHTSLPMILLTQDVEVKGAVFHQPSMLVTQDAAGQWNVAEAIDLITRAAGKNQAQEQTPEKPIALPAVTVDAGELKLIDRNGRTTTIQPLSVSGNPNGPLVWKYDAHVEDRLKLSGEVSPGGVWEHEVAFEVGDIAPWLSAWAKTAPALRASGTWHGHVDGPNVDGRITFDQLAIGTLSAQGAAMVQRQGNGDVSVSPNALVVNTTNALAQKLSMNSGALVLASTSVSAKDLVITVNGGEAKLNGAYSWSDQSASINAIWRDIALRPGVSNSGSATAKMSMPLPGAPRVEAQIDSSGKVPGRTWDTQLSVAGDGRSWQDMDWTVNLSHASWTGRYNAEISDLKATIAQRDSKLTLASLALAGGEMLNGSGEFNLDDLAWRLQLSGAKIPIQQVTPEQMAFRLRASGKGSIASVDELSVTSGQIEIQGNGTYDNTRPKPVFATVLLSHLPPLEGADPDAPIRGRVYGEVSLSGTVSPLDLGVDKGMLYGSNVFVGKRSLGNVGLQIVGRVTEDQARIETTEAQFFGGKWRVHAYWPGDHDSFRMQVDVADLSLAEIGALVEQPNVSGQLSGSWALDIPAPDRMRITASGISDLHDLSIGKFQAQRIHANSRLENGKLILDPIRLEQQDGRADVHIDLSVDHPTHLNVNADIRNWPATAPSGNASATVSAQSELAVDVANKSALGPLKAQVEFAVKDQNAGSLSIESTINGRVVNVQRVEAHALGGDAQGAGVLLIDQPMKSQARLKWSGLDAAQLAAFIPNTNELTGTVSGSAWLAPTDDPRALGPLKLQANVVSSDLRFRSIDIGHADLVSYFTGWRFVLDDCALGAAGGEIHLWARSTTHDAGVRSSQLQIDFKDLDLNTLDRAFDTNPKPMPGKVAGSFVLIGSPQDRDTLFGNGSVKITDSNLVNLGSIRALYDLMHIGADSASNNGFGSFDLRLDNNTLTLENARYFNRGVQVRARAELKNIWNLPDSPLDGVVIGSLRPLKDIKLPYMADADSILNALQQDLTAVRVKGSARHYEVVPISLDQAGETMRNVILGEVEKK